MNDNLIREDDGERFNPTTDDHAIYRKSNGQIEDRHELGKNELVKVHSQLYYGETTDIWCVCGDTFDDLGDAEEHLKDVDPARNASLDEGGE